MLVRKTKTAATVVGGLLATIAMAGCETMSGARGGGGGDPAFLRGDSQAMNAPPRESPATQPGQTGQIAIDNFTFKPATVSVAAGSAVVWINRDDVPHTVVADDRTFRSGTLDTDDRFTHVFPTAGTYKYFCGVHPHMSGVVIVR